MRHQAWLIRMKDPGLINGLKKVDWPLEVDEAFRSCRVKVRSDQKQLGAV